MQGAQFISPQYRCFCCPGGLESIIGNRNDRVDLGVDGLNAIEVCLRGELAGGVGRDAETADPSVFSPVNSGPVVGETMNTGPAS